MSNATSGSHVQAEEAKVATPVATAGEGNDLESQVTRIVTRSVQLKANILDDKLKYWHNEVDQLIESRFKDQNQAWFEHLS